MPADSWSPERYERFREERRQPFLDLLALVVPNPAMRVVDLGCGTGEPTRHLHDRLKASDTLGLDSSDHMLEKAREHIAPGLRFEKGDIATFASFRRYDLIFSNAALHWVPEQAALLGRLHALLAPGGQLAVQVPANDDHLSHTSAAEIAGEAPFREALGGHVRASTNLAPEEYASRLHELGFTRQHVRMQVYGHSLDSREDVVEWVRGTLLTDYEKRMPGELFTKFVARYREVLMPRLSAARPFFYTYKRVLFWAAR